MAGMVNRVSGSAAASLLAWRTPRRADHPTPPARARGGAALVTSASTAPAGDDAFRSAYRISGNQLVLLDQRVIPEKLEDRRGPARQRRRLLPAPGRLPRGRCDGTAGRLRAGPDGWRTRHAARCGSRLGAASGHGRRCFRRAHRRACRSGPWSAWSAVRAGLDEADDGHRVAAALRAEADAIAADVQAGHAAIVAGAHRGARRGAAGPPIGRAGPRRPGCPQWRTGGHGHHGPAAPARRRAASCTCS